MIKSKVIDSLKTLDKAEIKELNDLIDSPYFNKNKNVRALFAELRKYHPGFDNRNLSKENIYRTIFPGKLYADKTMRNLLSDLYVLIEKYLTLKNLGKRELLEKYLLITSLSERNLLKPAEQNIAEAAKLFEEMPFDGGNIFYIKHLIEMEKDYIEINRNRAVNLNMKEGEYIIYTFFSKYMAFKMKYINYRYKMKTENISVLADEFDRQVNLNEWMGYLEKTGGFESEIILTYYYTTRFMSDITDDGSFKKALGLFYKNKQRIDRTETTNLYLTFTGFCTVKMSKGSNEYAETLFELYNKMFEEKLLMNENEQYLHITIFNNVVTTALSLDKAEWTRIFIDEYAGKLLPEYTESMYHYTYARYYFAVKNFEAALEHLSRVTIDNFWIRSRIKILQLRIYFELGHIEAFFSLHDSIKHTLKTDKLLPQYEKDSDANFISLLSRLAKIKYSGSNEHLSAVKKDTENLIKGQLLKWLLEKIQETGS